MSPTVGNEDQSTTASSGNGSAAQLGRIARSQRAVESSWLNYRDPCGLPGIGNSCAGYSSGGDRRNLPLRAQW